MNPTRSTILILCLLSLSFLSACRTTQSGIQQSDFSSVLAQESQLVSNRIQMENQRAANTNKGMKPHWALLAAAVLGGVIMVFTSDKTSEKKSALTRRRKVSSKRRKK